MRFPHNLIQSITPPLYVVVGSEWADIVHDPQVKIVVSHQPSILKVGDGIITCQEVWTPYPNSWTLN